MKVRGDNSQRNLKFFKGFDTNNFAQKFKDFVALDYPTLLKKIGVDELKPFAQTAFLQNILQAFTFIDNHAVDNVTNVLRSFPGSINGTDNGPHTSTRNVCRFYPKIIQRLKYRDMAKASGATTAER